MDCYNAKISAASSCCELLPADNSILPAHHAHFKIGQVKISNLMLARQQHFGFKGATASSLAKPELNGKKLFSGRCLWLCSAIGTDLQGLHEALVKPSRIPSKAKVAYAIASGVSCSGFA